MARGKTDERITKRRVEMRNLFARTGADGQPVVEVHKSVDYVLPEHLDVYVADARTRWAEVEVSEEPDAGPGGYDGGTALGAHLEGLTPQQIAAAYGDASTPQNPLDEYLERDTPGVSGNSHYASSGGGSDSRLSTFLPRGLIEGPLLSLLLALAVFFGMFRGALLAVQTTAMKDILANAYHTNATFGAVYTTAPGASAGTEPTGGSPAYARKSLTWGANNAGTASATFDIPTSTTIVGAGVHSAVTAGTYYDGTSVTSQNFASQGTYTVTFTYTQS